ncbi:MAG: hypothetical protein IKL22_01940 [Lachnospiraceae bacterium]|nr:hypothetical protein [Lachnospiraceae bacterium]MBR6664459.1 hypothetical protein [Lachnospiraceae bacterium]
MKNTYHRIKQISGILVLLLLILYLGIFAFLNITGYEQHVDSDIAAEALLTREIWEQKTLTPDDWISSTERRILSMPMMAAPIYGMTGSMQTAVGIACVLLGGLFFWCFYFFLRKCGITKQGALIGLLMISALPINGIRNEGQMVPFVTLLLYLFAEYYVFHCILLFASILFYLYLKKPRVEQRKNRLFTWGMWFVLFGFTAVLSLGGQRCFQMVIIPLFVYESISLFIESDGFKNALKKERYMATAFVGTSILAGMLSLLYDRDANYAMYLLSPSDVVNKLFLVIPSAVLEGFGISGNVKLGGFASLMQLLVWAFLILTVYSMIFILRSKESIGKEQKESLLLLVVSFGVTAFIIAITTAEAAHNYLMVVWFVAILAVVMVYDRLTEDKSWFAHIILAAICVFAVMNLKYTWWPAVSTKDNLTEDKQVAEFLQDENLEYGYAEFWDASRISLLTDGEVTMGHSYRMEELGMYWWLTSTSWYPPNLPTDMKTAYVVRQEKKEAFERQFAQDVQMVLSYENSKYAVYISNKNFVNIP